MPEIKFVLKYPEKFLDKMAMFSYVTDRASKAERPYKNEKPNSFGNKLFRGIFFVLSFVSFKITIWTNEICKKIFKIDKLER